jgi:hypothetical protein
MSQMVVTPDIDWFSDPCPYIFFKGICDQQMHNCIPSREIHRLGPNEFTSID